MCSESKPENRLSVDNLVDALAREVPSIGPCIAAHLRRWNNDSPSLYLLFGDLVSDFVAPQLRSLQGRAELVDLFGFVERMAKSSDAEVQNLVAVGFCERLGVDPPTLAAARTFMGPETLRVSEEIEQFWGSEGK